jgi:prepilin-type N-terminal cleavage/methylation domain-containing protein
VTAPERIKPSPPLQKGQKYRRPPSNSQQPGQAGFTLIEILTVLVIAGLLIAIAAPAVHNTLRTMARQSAIKQISGRIIELPYLTWLDGQARVLGGKDTNTIQLPLPEGWTLDITQPIRYAFNGICTGGSLVINGPDQWRQAYQLDGPLCDQLRAEQP